MRRINRKEDKCEILGKYWGENRIRAGERRVAGKG